MTGIVETLSAGTAALTIFEKLVQLVESAKSSCENPRLNEVVTALFSSAQTVARNLSEATRKLNWQMSQSYLDLDLSIEQNDERLGFFDWTAKAQLDDFRSQYEGLYNNLTTLTDDITAVLICTNATEILAEANRVSRTVKKRLDEMVNSDMCIREILNELTTSADTLYYRLSGEEPSPPEPVLA